MKNCIRDLAPSEFSSLTYDFSSVVYVRFLDVTLSFQSYFPGKLNYIPSKTSNEKLYAEEISPRQNIFHCLVYWNFKCDPIRRYSCLIR